MSTLVGAPQPRGKKYPDSPSPAIATISLLTSHLSRLKRVGLFFLPNPSANSGGTKKGENV
jgi:hypothetical protein